MKRNLVLLGRIYRIQAHNYINDGSSLVLGIVMILLMTVCWLGFKPVVGDFYADPFILASAMGMSIIRNAQFNFSNVLNDWKTRGTFRRLSRLTVPKSLIAFGVISFSWMISTLILFVIFGIGMIFPQERSIIIYTDWPLFILGLFLHTILVSLLAIVPQVFNVSANMKVTICLISYYAPMYILGLGIPWNITGNVAWLNYLTYIFPHRYSLALIQAAFTWKAVPDMMLPVEGMKLPDALVHGAVKKDSLLARLGFGFDGKLWLVLLLIGVWIIIFALLAYWGVRRLYRFNLRKYRVYEGLNQRVHYIHQIQSANSLADLDLVIKEINSETKQRIKNKKQGGKQ